MQVAAVVAGGYLSFGLASFLSRYFGGDREERVQLPIDPLDPTKMSLGHLNRRDLSSRYQASEVSNCQIAEVVPGHRYRPSTL